MTLNISIEFTLEVLIFIFNLSSFVGFNSANPLINSERKYFFLNYFTHAVVSLKQNLSLGALLLPANAEFLPQTQNFDRQSLLDWRCPGAFTGVQEPCIHVGFLLDILRPRPVELPRLPQQRALRRGAGLRS